MEGHKEFISEDIQTLMKKTPSWTLRRGNTITVLVLILLLNLTWIIKYPDVIKGKALITTSIPPEKHFSRVFGKIDTLLVKNHDEVSAGDIIAIIQSTANYKDILLLQSILDTFNIHNQDFSSILGYLSIADLGSLEIAYADFENSLLDYELNSLYAPGNTKIKAKGSSIIDIENKLFALQLQKSQQQEETEFFKKNIDRYSNLYQKGVVSLSEYESKQIEYLNSKKRLANIISDINETKEFRNNAKVDFIDSDFSLKRQDKLLRNNLFQAYNKLRASILEWKRNYIITSSMDGTVSLNNFWSSNKTVNKGDLVCVILPNNTEYLIRIKTLERGLGKIKEGFKVNIDLHNYPAYENGYLLCEVSNIPVFPEEDGSYVINAIPINGLSTTYKKKIIFTQEMKGNAEIITNKTSLAERLFFSMKSLKKY